MPEVIAGGENWRFHAFRADGTETLEWDAEIADVLRLN